jgi:light-regulated signal transduction histidine kinase (bacteriophytochrome)
LYAVGLIEDITQRKRMEGALRRSNEELNQFAYAASHDLQEPLRTISTQTQLIARKYKGKLDAQADELIGYVVEGANRMQMLIQDLLTLSQVQGLEDLPAQPVEMNTALQLATKNLETALTESGAELTTSGITATVLAEPAQMAQIFQNLISTPSNIEAESSCASTLRQRSSRTVGSFQ